MSIINMLLTYKNSIDQLQERMVQLKASMDLNSEKIEKYERMELERRVYYLYQEITEMRQVVDHLSYYNDPRKLEKLMC